MNSRFRYTKNKKRRNRKKPNPYAIKVHYQKLQKNRSISMKHQLMLFKMLNPEAQILQCPGGNWRLVGRRRTGREELSEVRTSLYKESQREWCMLRAASPRQWVCRHGAAKQGTTWVTTWCPNSPEDLPMYMTKAPSVPGEVLQRHRALCRPQSPSANLGKYSGTESMLNPHLSQLHCFQGPIQTAQSELGM